MLEGICLECPHESEMNQIGQTSLADEIRPEQHKSLTVAKSCQTVCGPAVSTASWELSAD